MMWVWLSYMHHRLGGDFFIVKKFDKKIFSTTIWTHFLVRFGRRFLWSLFECWMRTVGPWLMLRWRLNRHIIKREHDGPDESWRDRENWFTPNEYDIFIGGKLLKRSYLGCVGNTILCWCVLLNKNHRQLGVILFCGNFFQKIFVMKFCTWLFGIGIIFEKIF